MLFRSKDNLKKRNWHGFGDCCFCGCSESIDHLFFKCFIARYVWRVIQATLNLDFIPKNTRELCDSWMNNPKIKVTNLLLFGCGTVFWAIWRTRNDWCFGEFFCLILLMSFFSVDFGWILGLFVRKRRKKKIVVQGSKLIRKIASEVLCRAYGWSPSDRHISR